MAVVYDSSGGERTASNVSSLSVAATNAAGTYMVGWVAVNVISATNLAMTYNGVSMTLVDSQAGNGWTMGIFTLVAPATGSNTLGATWTTADHAVIGMMTFTGVGSAGAVSKGNAASGSGGLSVTGTLGANDMLAGGFAYSSTAGNLSVTAGTERFEAGDSPTGNQATNTGTGSISVTWNRTTGTAIYMGIPLIAGGSSGPANLKSLDTNVKANIKSYNTNVLANIKSIDTNA